MDSVILAGGFATRLWPITKDRAKPLLPLGDRPIIDYLVNDLVNTEKIDKIYLSVNRRFQFDFEEYIQKNDYSDVELVIENSLGEKEKLGALGALNQVINKKDLSGPLLVVAGDNYVSFDANDFLDYFEEKDGTCLAAYEVSEKEASSYGVLDTEGEEVIDFEEKPEEPNSNLVSIAYYGFSEKAIEKLNRYINEGENPDAPGYFLQWLINKEKVCSYCFDGTWFDIGTPEGYLEANKTILNGKNEVVDSEVNGDSELKNIYSKNSAIRDSKLNNCIIFEGSVILGCELTNVIIDGGELVNEEISDELISNNDFQ